MRMQAAVFPIPGVVALPGASVEVHVFEPRYRQMVRDCVLWHRQLGIAYGLPHAQARRPSPLGGALDAERFKSNQQSYAPSRIFGVGDVTVQAQLPDGRYLIEVDVRYRVQLIDTIQEVPYMLADVEVLPPDRGGDEVSDAMFTSLLAAADAILEDKASTFRAFFDQDEGGGRGLGYGVGRRRPLAPLIYSILQWFQVGAEANQSLLEDESDLRRGLRLLTWMDRYLRLVRATPVDASPPKGRGGDPSRAYRPPGSGAGGEGGHVLPFRRPLPKHRPQDFTDL